MTLYDDLVAAKALIDTPEKWEKGQYCSGGCYCALGAGMFITGKIDGGELFEDALRGAVPQSFIDTERARRGGDPGQWWVVISYNDHPRTTHADIMALFDRAIASALHSTEGERK